MTIWDEADYQARWHQARGHGAVDLIRAAIEAGRAADAWAKRAEKDLERLVAERDAAEARAEKAEAKVVLMFGQPEAQTREAALRARVERLEAVLRETATALDSLLSILPAGLGVTDAFLMFAEMSRDRARAALARARGEDPAKERT